MTVAYLDAFSGVAGDMLLGACVDAGAELDGIEKTLRRLPLEGWALRHESVDRAGFAASRVSVDVSPGAPARHLSDVRALLDKGELEDGVARKVLAVFTTLFEAEARVHGSTPEKVHLHEAGAVDAVVDIVGSVAALEALGVERLVVSPLPLGGGQVEAAHGTLPVPSPATLEILRGVPVRGGPVEAELVTPTGAALVATLAAEYGPLPSMLVRAVGIGAGGRELARRANVCRLILGDAPHPEDEHEESASILEANIDDMSPQLAGHLVERLLEAGALDATLSPLAMKKGRPGMLVSVVARLGSERRLEDVMFAETTTLGVRRHEVRRRVLGRRMEKVETPWGPVAVKVALRGGEIHGAQPEYEEARALALSAGVPLRRVQEAALEAWARRMRGAD